MDRTMFKVFTPGFLAVVATTALATDRPPGQGPDLKTANDPQEVLEQVRTEYGSAEGPARVRVIAPSRSPIRRGHGGWQVYDRAGRAQFRLEIPTTPKIVEVPGERLPEAPERWGLLYGLRRQYSRNENLIRLQSAWSAKGLRVVSDVHMLAQVSEPIFDLDVMQPLNDAVEEFRRVVMAPISATFEPSISYLYQHATEVREGFSSARSTLYYGIDGAVTLWSDPDTSGRIVYNVQAQSGVFTAVQPFLGTAVGSPMLMNNMLVSSDFNLYMLYYVQELFDRKVRISIGKFEDQVFFDRNAIAYNPGTQFLYEGFNQSITNPFPGYAFGVMATWDLHPQLSIRAGTMNSEGTGTSTGFENLAADHLFSMIELDYQHLHQLGSWLYEGNYRFMFWYNSIGRTGTGKSPRDAAGWGATFNMDQRLPSDVVTFCRVGWGENEVTASNFSVSAGFGLENFLGRQGDCLGFAGSWSKLTGLGRYQVGLPPTPGDQTVFELFWRINMTDTLQVSPVLQYLADSGADIDGSLIWGLRSIWSF